MKIFKKLDDYLLHYYPSIWITRVHYFLPLGLGIFALLFFGNLTIGWSPKDDFPESYIAVVLMIIPILIYLVYWFVFQSRYNVAKSGGRMTLGFEYLNFFSYMLVFFMAFLIIVAVPLSNLYKVKINVNKEELIRDIENLNKGNVLVNNVGTITFTEYGTIEYYEVNYVYNYYIYDGEDYYSEVYPPAQLLSITRNEALIFIGDYIKSYNKYSHQRIQKTAQEILREREENLNVDNYYYSDDSWQTQYKLSELDERAHTGEWFDEFQEPWFWKITFGFIAFSSLLVWLFKQMKLRHFVIGFISICLTPLLVAIVGVIIFELLGYCGDEEKIVSLVCFFVYALLIYFSIRGYKAQTLNYTGYVMTMYLQFFLPLLPMFLWFYFIYQRNFSFIANEDDEMNLIYWCGWITGLLSILVFKPLYTKFGSLPARN